MMWAIVKVGRLPNASGHQAFRQASLLPRYHQVSHEVADDGDQMEVVGEEFVDGLIEMLLRGSQMWSYPAYCDDEKEHMECV